MLIFYGHLHRQTKRGEKRKDGVGKRERERVSECARLWVRPKHTHAHTHVPQVSEMEKEED